MSLGAVLVAASCLGHGMMISPEPRNARDRHLPAFQNGSWPATTDGCNCAFNGGGCAAATGRAAGGGQPCLWFSQGCTIGCDKCTGTNGHTTVRLCNGTMQPTNNNPATRTMNRGAVAGSKDDTYRYNPWRAPGYAPVSDPCGMAGGTLPGHAGAGEAKFAPTPWAKQGDLGSRVLAPANSTASWVAGSSVEVSWGIRYNHGGGYQYRLCPASEPLTEACLQRTPLAFAGKPRLRWNNGSEAVYTGVYVTEGTSPKGSAWAMNPIPRINPGPGSGMPGGVKCGDGATDLSCRQFDPSACKESGSWPNKGVPQPWQKLPGPTTRNGDVEGYCSGDWTGGQLIDTVRIPHDLPAGKWVLGFRWDCEETTQVWASCADVTITKP